MKNLPRLAFLLCLLVIVAGPTRAADLAQHPVFKHYLGQWSAEGELKNANGEPVKIKEDWTGSADGENSFTLKGTRTINGDTQPFTWTFTHNPATDTYEAVHVGNDPSQALRFEANVSEVTTTIDLKAITGTSGSVAVVEKFTDNKFETLASEITFTNDQGMKTLEGTIMHKKVKGP